MTEQSSILLRPCAEQEENLVLLHYGELPPAERNAVEKHLQTCSGCTGYLRDLQTVLPLTLKADEPSERFWADYSRELRQKLDRTVKRNTWWQDLRDFFQPRQIPAFAAVAVIALALAFTVGRSTWLANDPAPEDVVMVELLPVAENLEFFNAMEVLDNLDLLESMANQGSAT